MMTKRVDVFSIYDLRLIGNNDKKLLSDLISKCLSGLSDLESNLSQIERLLCKDDTGKYHDALCQHLFFLKRDLDTLNILMELSCP